MSTYTGVTNFKNSPVFWPTLYYIIAAATEGMINLLRRIHGVVIPFR